MLSSPARAVVELLAGAPGCFRILESLETVFSRQLNVAPCQQI